MVSYLPEELRNLPDEIIVFDDRCGFWAGIDAPRVRYLEVSLNPSAIADRREIEVVPGQTVDWWQSNILLFYYLGEDSKWHCIGHFATYHIEEVQLLWLPFQPEYGHGLAVQSNHSGGNDYHEPWLNFFTFEKQDDGSVRVIDHTIELTGVTIKELVDLDHSWPLELVAYAGWQCWGGVCHAASPDRALILNITRAGRLENASADFPSYYQTELEFMKKDLRQQVADGYARCFNDVSNDYYIGYVITTLIYYHDMGKHDEGVKRSRELFAREYCANDDHYEAMQDLIDEAIEKLAEQDAEIQESIDEYNSMHAPSNGS